MLLSIKSISFLIDILSLTSYFTGKFSLKLFLQQKLYYITTLLLLQKNKSLVLKCFKNRTNIRKNIKLEKYKKVRHI